MIQIAGRPAEPQSLLSPYPPRGVERSVLEIMLASPNTYQFKTPGALEFEVTLRRATVDAARALDRSGMDFEIFRRSRCNHAYWNRAANGGFELRHGVKPSEAIRDIFDNGSQYGTECATAIVIVFYKAVLDIYSAPLFDRTFPDIFLMDWQHIDPLFRSVGAMRPTREFLPGDRMYFINPDVNPATPEWQGENVIMLAPDSYYGHGMGIQNGAAVIRNLNSNRAEDARESAYLLKRAGRPDFDRLMEIQQSEHH